MSMGEPRLGLGIDAGGSRTRWALAEHAGAIVAEGHVRGFSALQAREERRVRETMSELAHEVLMRGQPSRIHAGLTGFGDDSAPIRTFIAVAFDIAPEAVTIGSDIETAYLDLFAPGQGYMVYAGTGSVAAFIDEEGTVHRAGGRGVTLDDGGGGFWIGREALREIWRAEDERPGSWRDSPMAAEIFKLVGGPDWARSRQFIYGAERGDMGRLALAVATTAESDPVASEILRAAGGELARLARAMRLRFGPREIALTGRVTELHPLIANAMREALPDETRMSVRESRAHHAAARIALERNR